MKIRDVRGNTLVKDIYKWTDQENVFMRELLQQDFKDLGGIVWLSGFRKAFPSLWTQAVVWQAPRKLITN